MKEARNKIEDLEEQNQILREQSEARSAELSTIADDNEQKSKELSSLRNRLTLSQQNWAKEREDLIQRESYAKDEFETARQAMSDWEVLAMEERSIRENVAEKVADLEEQVANHREAHERAASERDSNSATVEGLQRALQEIQDGKCRSPVNDLYACQQCFQLGEKNYEKLWKIRRRKSKICKGGYEKRRPRRRNFRLLWNP